MIRFVSLSLAVLVLASPVWSQTIGAWDRIDILTEFPLWDVTFTDTLNGYVVGDYGAILRTTDGGFTWTQTFSPDQHALRNVHFFNDSTGVTAGFRGSVARTTDRGLSWHKVPIPFDLNFPGMSAYGSTVWICGEEGIILKSTDQGLTWATIKLDTEILLGSISFADEKHGWMASIQRKLWHTTDGGMNWKEQKLDTFLPVAAIHAISPMECWLAGYQGLILHTTDAGKSWMQPPSYQADFYRITMDSTGAGWAVGRRGAIVRGRAGNNNWRLHDVPGTHGIHAITFLPDGAAVAVGDMGMIFRLYSIGAGEISTPPAESKH